MNLGQARAAMSACAFCGMSRKPLAALRRCWGADRAYWSHEAADVPFRAPGATSRPLLDDFRMQKLSDQFDAETGIGSGVLGVELELGVGEAEPVGVDHDAR